MAAYIDPVSGCVSLNDSQAASLLQAGGINDLEYTDGLLRSLLHESTHHASLVGKVGCAYAALCLGTTATSLTHLVQPRDQSFGSIDLRTRDRLFHHFFMSFHGPILEGLALFAEYDLYSNPVTIESAPLLHAKSLYLMDAFRQAIAEAAKSLRSPTSDADAAAILEEIRARREKHFNDALRSHRLTVEAKALKARLLSQPLMHPPDGESHYLLGYLAIKGLYRVCRSIAPLRLTTLFHLAVQQQFFSDSQVAEHMVRIDDLDVMSVQATLHQLKERVQNSLEVLVGNPGAILIALNAIENNVFEELDPHLQVLCGIRISAEGVPLWGPNYVGTRHVFRHACTSVRFAHEESVTTVLSMDGLRLGSCVRVQKADLDESGSIELVQTPNLEHQALVVLSRHGLIAVRCLRTGEWNRVEQVKAFDELPSALPALALMRNREALELSMERYEAAIAELLQKITDSNEEFRAHVLINMAFLGKERHVRESARDMLSTAGFASLFPDHEVQELADYSLVFGGEGLSLPEGSVLLGRTEAGCLRRLKEFNAKSDSAIGICLFEITDEHVIAFV